MKNSVWMLAALAFASTGYAQENETESSSFHPAVGMGIDQGLSVVAEIDKAYRVALGNDGLAVDYIAKRGRFDDPDFPAHWFIGAGAWKNWESERDLGLRVPLGLEWTYQNQVKVYGQIQPELALHDEVKLDLGAALGVMYQF